jgi:hypothetical protein
MVQESAAGTRSLADEVSHLRTALTVFKLSEDSGSAAPVPNLPWAAA